MLQPPDPIDFAAMSAPTTSPLLARLRRSTRLAAFMAFVMVAKLMGGYVCLGEQDVGQASDSAARQVAWIDDGPHASAVAASDHADPQSAHNAGSCCHCSCHQVTTLPAGVALVQAQLRRSPLPATVAVAVPSRLERELRPPIV